MFPNHSPHNRQTSSLRISHLRRPPRDLLGRRPSGAPKKSSILFIIAIALLFFLGLFLYLFNLEGFITCSTIALMTTFFSLIPTLSYKITSSKGASTNFVIEFILFSSFILVSRFILFGSLVPDGWVVYAIGLVFIVQTGGYLIEWHMSKTLNSAKQCLDRIATVISGESKRAYVEQALQLESFSYSVIPIGGIIGAISGLISGFSLGETLILCLRIVLLMSSIILFIFIISSSLRMSDSMFESKKININNQRKTLIDSFLHGSRTKEEIEESLFQLSRAITALRSVYLYNSMHNAILITVFFSPWWAASFSIAKLSSRCQGNSSYSFSYIHSTYSNYLFILWNRTAYFP